MSFVKSLIKRFLLQQIDFVRSPPWRLRHLVHQSWIIFGRKLAAKGWRGCFPRWIRPSGMNCVSWRNQQGCVWEEKTMFLLISHLRTFTSKDLTLTPHSFHLLDSKLTPSNLISSCSHLLIFIYIAWVWNITAIDILSSHLFVHMSYVCLLSLSGHPSSSWILWCK